MSSAMITLPLDREPILRVIAQPSDVNASGAIFGGWLMAQLDLAGAQVAALRAKGPIATVAVTDLRFLKPIFVHDLVSFYAQVAAVGRTSITVSIEAYAQRLCSQEPGHSEQQTLKISTATLVYVAVARPGEKRLVPMESIARE